MKFDIIAVTYNSSKWLDKFFVSLENLDYDKSQLTLVLADNASDDDTLIKAKNYKEKSSFKEVKTIQSQKNLGFGSANNLGVKNGGSEYILLLNVDTEIHPEALKNLENYIISAPKGTVGFEMRQQPVEWGKHYDPLSLETSWCCGACFAIKRAAFEAVEGFDENIFMYADDIDLSWRLRANGGKLMYCPKAVITHHGWQKSDGGNFEYLHSAYAKLLLAYKYGDFQLIKEQNIEFIKLIRHPRHFPNVRKDLLKLYFKHFSQTGKFTSWKKKYPQLFSAKVYDFSAGFAPDRGQIFLPESDFKPWVSVVIRTHERKEMLRKTLESLRHQTYENFEIVIVEDGKPTAQRMIEADFSDLNINYFATVENVGRGRAGNIGIERSKGEYVCFLDDDDFYYADCIETFADKLAEDKTADLVISSGMAFKMSVISKDPYTYTIDDIYPVIFDHITLMDMCVKCRIPMPCGMFRRSLYDICTGMREDIGGDEDWAMWLKFISKGKRLNKYNADILKATSMFGYPADEKAAQKRLEEYEVFDRIMLSDETLKFTVMGQEIKDWETYVQNDVNHLKNIGKLTEFLNNLKPLGINKLEYNAEGTNTLTAWQINNYYYYLVKEYAKKAMS